ncbi:unnamed protein product [Adineta steineri]|nr:unnamed protein product [Adineta steineri]
MTTVNELLKRVTDKLDLVMDDHFLYCHLTSGDGFKPNGHDILHNLMYTSIELHQKVTYQIILNNQLNASGIDIIQEYPLTIFIKNVRKRSEGERLGIMKGDEIIMINNINVKDLDSTTFNRYLNQIPITLTFRSSRLNEIIHTSHTIQSRKITFSTIKYTKEIDQLSSVFTKPNNESQLKTNIFNINNEQQSHNIFHSNNQQIQKIIFELIETETSYVQDLQCLIDQYIEPLRNNSIILPSDAVESLYNSVKIIHQLQTRFLDYLQSNLLTKNIIISIAETFIRLSNDFKLYSTYCIIHLQINRLLNLYQNNEQLKDFLIACNPYHQHSSSFQSYLIKPVQRILKYPLFLQQMFIYCTTEENDQILLKEKSKLKKAIKIMNKINGYINSMQQLYEDFGQSFENFVKNYQEKQNKIFELNLSDLYAYGEIKWINMYRFISKKNSQNLKIFCFIFQNGCLLLVREQLNKKNQSSLFNSQSNSNTSDCFLRFLPMEQLQVEVIHLTDTSHTYTWQLIQTDPTTHFQTYFHFANRDAEIFVKTINNCISQIQCENNEYICISNICDSLAISFDEEHILSSRSCHNLLPISSLRNEYSEKNRSRPNRQSQSPIWKRRTLSLRKRPFSMTHNKDII